LLQDICYNSKKSIPSPGACLMQMKMIVINLFLIVIFGLYTGYGQSEPTVKNIIFFIGDGMGIDQISVARIEHLGADGLLNLDKLPVTGLVKTHSIDNLITDSAAGATAMATGYKTRNGMVGVLPDSTAVLTILEAARDRGMSTGLVVTSSITHATPACFASHVASRANQSGIARQLLHEKVDVLLGGGRMYFLSSGTPGSVRKDTLNLIKMAVNAGYSYLESRDELLSSGSGKLLGLFARDGFENKPDEPSLAEMTEKALDILSKNETGFFLMVEGSQIDWGGHENNLAYTTRELLAFDQALRKGVEFADAYGNTLIVVTADHETGGLDILGGQLNGQDLQINWATKHHTAQMVPLYAFGPHASEFAGTRDNTSIPVLMARLLGITEFPSHLTTP
jgi:alkaline phosphatase